jgi:hypothetical protein
VFNPQISGLSTTTVAPGDQIQVAGSGFDPSRQYVIAFQQNGRQTTIKPATDVPPNGTFTTTVRIPSSPTAQPGAAFIVACITSPGQAPAPCTQQQITVQ